MGQQGIGAITTCLLTYVGNELSHRTTGKSKHFLGTSALCLSQRDIRKLRIIWRKLSWESLSFTLVTNKEPGFYHWQSISEVLLQWQTNEDVTHIDRYMWASHLIDCAKNLKKRGKKNENWRSIPLIPTMPIWKQLMEGSSTFTRVTDGTVEMESLSPQRRWWWRF